MTTRRFVRTPQRVMNMRRFSMPDSFEHTLTLTMRMPNGALASLAGTVDAHHQVAVADLERASVTSWEPSAG